MVYDTIKEEPKGERYENETTLISHVTTNDSWIIDNGCSHHMTSDISKFENLKKLMMVELLSLVVMFHIQ